jgi:glycosyltransferase involved in cell wall biosynthesis
MNARVSICIPCFNTARWIAQAVQSALDQTWSNKEVIVVDDGSTDGSVEILETFGTKLRLIRGPHRGSNAARNEALRVATGEWIQFLDADDFLLPEKIARQFAEAAVVEAHIIFSPVWFEQDGQRRASEIDRARDAEMLWLAWKLPQTGGCLWRKSALEALSGWNEATPFCQEFELYRRAIEAGLRFCFAPTANAVYRVWSEESLCRKDPRQVVAVRTELYRGFIAWLDAHGRLTSEGRALAGKACFEMARTLAKLDLAEAARYHRDRKEERLIHLAGPAAPLSYRAAYRTLGFTFAERLASTLRRRAA